MKNDWKNSLTVVENKADIFIIFHKKILQYSAIYFFTPILPKISFLRQKRCNKQEFLFKLYLKFTISNKI
ncbi:hypothetical protein BpHYR1_026255 [Brachionus plicatilis]|uniref:Uncharacterized protein n=1 Tax=Brachionus plicatilis TaxID=10195 RepID=A0A3M7Q5S4_BRAPC|nr:hypothetical protein BpHYR1_026255 [Brachionus plicatilis]